MSYPKRAVIKPSALKNQTNGMLPKSILEDILGVRGSPTIRLLKDSSARAWKAMFAHALRDGVVLSATSLFDSYRPYDIQVRIFQERYTLTPINGQPSRIWHLKRYWQRLHTASAAVPGTSNHGDALAVDNKNTSEAAIAWLRAHADDYGWSWELDSEPWHIHYFAGDNIPQAVLEFEGGSNNEDDDMLAGFDKTPEDVARATIRELCDTHWGKKQMTVEMQSMLLAIWRDKGREQMMIDILDSPKNKS